MSSENVLIDVFEFPLSYLRDDQEKKTIKTLWTLSSSK